MKLDIRQFQSICGQRSRVLTLFRVSFAFTLALCSVTSGQERRERHLSGANSHQRVQREEIAHATTASKSSFDSSALWTTIIAASATLGTLGTIAYWIRLQLGLARSLSRDAVESLGRRSIEPKVAIHLVRCGNRILVLGVSPDGARTLSEITDPSEVRQLMEACQGRDFRPFGLNSMVGGDHKSGIPGEGQSRGLLKPVQGSSVLQSFFRTGERRSA